MSDACLAKPSFSRCFYGAHGSRVHKGADLLGASKSIDFSFRNQRFILSVLAVGANCSIRKHSVFLTAFFLFYLLLILGRSFSPIRDVSPIVPLFLLFVFRGIYVLEDAGRRIWCGTEKLPLGFLARVPVYLIVGLNTAWLASTVQPSNDHWARGPYGQRIYYSWAGFLKTSEWVRQYVEGKAIKTFIATLPVSYPAAPQLVFTSSDKRHEVYKIPEES